MNEIIIHIQPHSEGGYNIDLYANQEALETQETLDGGICESENLSDAIEMASRDALDYVKLHSK